MSDSASPINQCAREDCSLTFLPWNCYVIDGERFHSTHCADVSQSRRDRTEGDR
jgi:adenylylsulfate kinase-like enzyme